MDDKSTPEEKPSRDFLLRLYDEIKASVGESGFSLDALTAAVRKARAHAGGKMKAKNRQMGEQSLTDIIERVNAALSNQFRQPLTGYSIFYYAKEVYADRVIACSSIDSKLFEIPYAITGDDVTFGEPVEVEETYTPVGMNELASLCAKGHSSKLFIEASFAEPPEWIPYLPKPGEFKHPVYGGIVITKERNEAFVQNFGAGVYQERLPVDAEHETKLSGAVGWITEMRVNDDGSADARVEWTDRGKSLIESDRFRYVSPEWYDEWTEPASGEKHSDVAIGAALTTRPFFKEGSLRPLVANEQGLYAPDDSRTDFQTHTYHFAALAPTTHEGAPKAMADEKPPEKTEEPSSFAEMQVAVQAAEARAERAEGEARQMGERLTTLEREGRTRRFSDAIKQGGWLGKPEDHLALMETLGEGTDAFKTYVAQQNAVAEQAKDGKLFAEIGSEQSGGGDAWGRVKAAAEEMVKAGTAKTFAQAVEQVAQTNPQLYRDYQAEQRTVN